MISKIDKMYFKILFITLFLSLNTLFCTITKAQFYDGHQMTFGKNRVQYNNFYWQYFRFDNFDIYFYQDGKELAENTAKIAQTQIKEIEDKFEYPLDGRIILLLYNKLSDFRQSNIGLSSDDASGNIGGVTRIIGNKVFVYYEGDKAKYKKQIRASIAELTLNHMLYGGSIRDKIASSTLLNLPEWYISGLISYISEEWNVEIENKVKDGILSGKYKKLNWLMGEDAKYAGHSIWKFVADTYGKSIVSNILYMTRINRDASNGFMYVLGLPLKDISVQWENYYKEKYEKLEAKRDFPTEGEFLKKIKEDAVYQNIKISPNSRFIAYTTNQMGKYKVWIYDTETKIHKKILSREHKLEQVTDYSYPLLAWHPASDQLTILTEAEGAISMTYYNIQNEQLENRSLSKKNDKRLFYFEKILDFSYSPDGRKYVFSAVRKGQTDIFVYNILANNSEQLTFDEADDFNPRFIDGGNKIIFSSNRTGDTLVFGVKGQKLSRTSDLWVFDYKNKSNVLDRISNTPYVNETQPIEIKNNNFIYLSDQNGVVNRRAVVYDSVVDYVDTTIHYRYFSDSYPLSNYSRSILKQDYNPQTEKFAEIIFQDGKNHLFFNNLKTNQNNLKNKLENSSFRNKLNEKYKEQDSLAKIKPKKSEIVEPKKIEKPKEKIDNTHPDSLSINVNDYEFETERETNFYELEGENLNKKLEEAKNKSDSLVIPKAKIYRRAFYANQTTIQADFSFLSNSYQSFNNGGGVYSPGFSLFTKIGTLDLFEDYRIIGGFRLSGDLESNEYFLSFEDLKKRVNKQYIFHRRVINSTDGYYSKKVRSNQLFYILRYPFSQVTALKATFSSRYENGDWLANSDQTLKAPNDYWFWQGAKLEYIFDNTRSLGLNLYEGTRFKIFGEFFQQFFGDKQNLAVIGADFRHYIKIHRSLIWANRFACSTNFGNAKLIYYLGSVDGWINLSPDVETFNKGIPFDNNYTFQTLASNLRGFTQNIRNGESFALINSELRCPIIRYLANHPISSGFLNNLQVVGFFDVGSAWVGATPYSGGNSYDDEIIERGDLKVTIDLNRSPWVYGYGFGLRSRLLGYFIRADWAWGVDGGVVLDPVFYLSLNLDF